MEPTIDYGKIKENMRRTWTAGDFGKIAQYAAKSAEEFAARLEIVAGMRVLDVACGTGNTAIPAARKGAHVTGVDIAPNLLEQARANALAEGIVATFEEGDAENLPYESSQYDLVISMFGAMFAPRPEQVAAELIRVCRPGGRIAMANWTPNGFAGQMFRLTAQHLPPPEGIAPPALWGDEVTVRQRFAAATSEVRTTRRTITMDFPFPPREVVQFFRDYFGPTRIAFSRLDASGQEAYAAALEALWTVQNQSTDGHTSIENEYLEVIVFK